MIVPVILSGGSGTRLWPLSRLSYPKQFLNVGGGRSLLQQTSMRTAGAGFAPPVAVSNEEQRFLIAHHLLEAGTPPSKILLEPAPRNTGPAAAAASLYLSRSEDPLLLLLPADHVISDTTAFRAAVATGSGYARDGCLVTFGIQPDRPHTGYGYIEAGARLGTDGAPLAHEVERFVEKPDAATARSYVDSGRHFWNGGIFLFRADTLVAELSRHASDILEPIKQSVIEGARDGNRLHPEPSAFGRAKAQSIDHALMEKAERVAVVPVRMGWSDIGSWDALHDAGEPDAEGNVASGDVLALDTHNCLLRSDGPTVVTLGVEDLVVVATAEGVLVSRRGDTQRVREAVARLKDRSKAGGS